MHAPILPDYAETYIHHLGLNTGFLLEDLQISLGTDGERYSKGSLLSAQLDDDDDDDIP